MNVPDKDGRTALHHAYLARKSKVASLLIGLGADQSLRDNQGVSPAVLRDRQEKEAASRAVRLHKREVAAHVHGLCRLALVRELTPADLEPFGIDVQDDNGDTALHVAYRRDSQDAVDRLLALGASQEVRNGRGLLPRQEGEVHRVVPEIITLAHLVHPRPHWSGTDWTDADKARDLYDRLQSRALKVFLLALFEAGRRRESQEEVFRVAVKLGRYGSENTLVRVLKAYGTRAAASVCLNSGSPTLESAAHLWAGHHGYKIYHSAGVAARWGVF